MATRSALIAAFAFDFTVSALGQTGAPERKPSFEVASVKPNKETGGSFSLSGNRQTFIGTTAGSLIARIGNGGINTVGDRRSVRANQTGRLYLGVNDDHLADNAGSFRVMVDVRER